MRRTKLFKWMFAIALSVSIMGNAVCIKATELSDTETQTEEGIREIEEESVTEETGEDTKEEVITDNTEVETENEIVSEVDQQKPGDMSSIDYNVPILSYEEFKNTVANGVAMYSDAAVPVAGEKSIDEMPGGVYSIDDFNLDYELSVDVSNISGERTLPEPNLLIYVNNVDSLKNGAATTQTELVWLFHDSDADGDRIVDRELRGFPEGYVSRILRETDGTPYGFTTHFFNPGTYTVDYYVIDSNQEINGIRYTLDVLTVGDYDVYTGNLTSANDVHAYNVPIDFSSMSEAVITLVQPEETDMLVTITNENGEEVKRISTSDGVARNWWLIDKPADVNRVYNYTVTVAVKNNDYHEGSAGYKVMAGSVSNLEEMLSYVDGAVLLGKYTATDTKYDFRTGYNQVVLKAITNLQQMEQLL